MKIKCEDGRTREFIKERVVTRYGFYSEPRAQESWQCALCKHYLSYKVTTKEKKERYFMYTPSWIKQEARKHCCVVCDVCHKSVPSKTFYITDGTTTMHLDCYCVNKNKEE